MRFPSIVAGLTLLASTTMALAVNPFVTLHYAADPSAHVFEGRIYVYATHDRNDAKEFDTTDHHVYSSDDLQNWQDHGPVLDIKDVPWAGPTHLWAPDAAFVNGTYYLAICPRGKDWAKSKDRPIGFATSKSPVGPFKAMDKPLAGVEGIDPSVFIDDDGQAYITWAGAGPQIAKLTADMTAIDGKPQKVLGIEHFFEGPWVFKRQGVYYLTYPGLMQGGSGRGGSGQWYSYATSDKPMGPYQFKADFTGTKDGNIHGSQIEYGGRWYMFYHDFSTSYGRTKRGFKRAIRVDELDFNPDGTIVKPFKWTADGPKQLKPLDPYRRNEAECLAQCDVPEGDHAIDTAVCPGGRCLTKLNDGDWVRYNGVNFADGAATFEASVKGPGGAIEVRLDARDGPLVGTCDIPAGDSVAWRTVSATATNASGGHDLYLVFRGDNGRDLFEIDFWRFAK